MSTQDPVRLQVIIPFHQPLTADDDSIAQACEACYVPLLDAIEEYENLRVSLHFGGHLLDYMAREREDLLLRIKTLTKRGQVEVLGGLFYGGVPALLGEMDVRGQIEMSGEFWDSFLGQIPTGVWLPELAWTPELPRLFEETGIVYGFIASGQLHMSENTPRSLGCVERGGQRLPAFVLDSPLSTALPSRPVDEWVRAALDRGGHNPHRLLSVWVRAESLGLEPGTQAWCMEGGWLRQWFAALSENQEFELVLPEGTYPGAHPVEPLRLSNVCAPELHPMGDLDGVVDWPDFPFLFPEVDTLYRRMLRASDKLRDAIATMEDEELETTWSDSLATAQRLVFSAQAPDAYWRGATPGFSDPVVRDATMARLARAETMIDTLVHDDDDWISTEEADLDGDLAEEVFVSTRHLMAWLVPAQGGDIHCLDDRLSERSVLDVGGRRAEPFFEAMAKAPQAGGSDPKGLPRRGENLTRLSADLPTDSDMVVRRGMRQWVVEANTDARKFFAGTAANLTPGGVAWDVLTNSIDEEGDLSYTLSLKAQLALTGAGERQLHIEKHIHVPIDVAQLRLRCDLRLEQGAGVLWALEIPVRLGAEQSQLWVNGKEIDTSHGVGTATEVSEVRLQNPDGLALELQCEPGVGLWWLPVRTTLRDLGGYRAVDQGFILVPHALVKDAAEVAIDLTLTS